MKKYKEIYLKLLSEYQKSMKKKHDNRLYFHSYFYRPLSFIPTPLFILLRISANQVTIGAGILSVAAFLIMPIYGNALFFSIFFFIAYLLDFCDGNIARYNNKPSFFGKVIDGFFDSVRRFWVISYACLLYREEVMSRDLFVLVIILACLCFVVDYLCFRFLTFINEAKIGRVNKNESIEDRKNNPDSRMIKKVKFVKKMICELQESFPVVIIFFSYSYFMFSEFVIFSAVVYMLSCTLDLLSIVRANKDIIFEQRNF